MQRIINQIKKNFINTTNGLRMLEHLEEMQKHHPGWKAYVSIIEQFKAGVAAHMLSDEFTRLSAEDKNAHQIAYNIVHKFCEFMLEPVEKTRREKRLHDMNKAADLKAEQARRKKQKRQLN